MATIDTRREQMFPKLEPREIDRLRRFGQVRRYRPGEALFVTGEVAPGMFVLIKGSVRVTAAKMERKIFKATGESHARPGLCEQGETEPCAYIQIPHGCRRNERHEAARETGQ